jgi:phenylpropionate dioxygenase-like ring-hydroxylating dioxygenase large terminal subunit
MELVTTLKSQTVHNQVRKVGINPNHWYPIGWGKQLKPGDVTSVVVWQQSFAIYRDMAGQIHALEDFCPHRGVALHKGIVRGNNLICQYHGWEFDGSGQCVNIPYIPEGQKLPCARARSYPVREQHGLIWIFPGDPALANKSAPVDMPQFSEPGWLRVPVTSRVEAHFSICNENGMDIFHGFLHRNLQGWFDPLLLSLRETEEAVCAEYRVSYKHPLAKFLGLSERGDRVTTQTVSSQYCYPHCHTALSGISYLYLLRLPEGPTASRSFAIFFLRVRLPQWILKPLEPLLVKVLQHFVFYRFLSQDIEMMESEQQNYLANTQRRYVEINPVIIATQRLVIRQYEQFVQKSSELPSKRSRESFEPISSPEAVVSESANLAKANSAE